MKVRFLIMLMACLWMSRGVFSEDYPFGRVNAEQIEQVFLRSDRTGSIEFATASLTINAQNPSPGDQALLELQNNGSPVFVGRANGSVEATGKIQGNTLMQLLGGSAERVVPIQEDDQDKLKQATFYGTCSDGTVTFSSDGWESFKADCTPVVVLAPVGLDEGDSFEPNLYWWTLENVSSSGFSYKVYRWGWNSLDFGWQSTNQDITSSVTVHWQVMGWLD